MVSTWTPSNVVVVTPPSSESLATQTVLDYVRQSQSEASLLSRMVTHTRVDLERRLGRALSHQVLMVTYIYFLPQTALVSTIIHMTFPLYLPPVNSVSLVEAMTGQNTWVTYDPQFWHFQENKLTIDDITTLYAVDRYLYIRVTYDVGSSVLDPADEMMWLQYVAHYYAFREDDTMPEGIASAIMRSKVWEDYL